MRGIVAIVGRPNVGKSTLFNRLTEDRTAIVDDTPGVTRDRIYGVCEWNGRQFNVVDTGGYIAESDEVFAAAIREQVEIALDEADVVLFLVNVVDGVTPADEDIADAIRRKHKAHVLLVANKVDNYMREHYLGELYGLGVTEVLPISAINGQGSGDLLDRVVELLPEEADLPDSTVPRVAIVGRPNVGKSSLVNALLNRPQNIVTPIAGTTRDSIHTRYSAFGFDYYLVDTAGLRRKAKVSDNIEFYSTIRTMRAIELCDVAMLMLDAQEGIQQQDLTILRHIHRSRRGLIILANKWDLVEKEKGVDVEFRNQIEEKIAPLSHVPIIFTSATDKTRIHKAMEEVRRVFAERSKHISTKELNDTLLPLMAEKPPHAQRGRMIRIKHVTQVKAWQPTFVFFCTHPTLVPENYRRFLVNIIRKHYGFDGWELVIKFKES